MAVKKYSPQDWDTQMHVINSYLNKPQRYNQNHLPPPFMVEFLGIPSAGKSSTVHITYKFLALLGVRVRKYQEPRERFNKPNTNPIVNVRAGLKTLDLIFDLEESPVCDIALFEKGIFDAYCWMNFWHQKGLLSEKECAEFKNFFSSRLWANLIPIVFCFMCEPDTSIERNSDICLIEAPGETINPIGMQKTRLMYEQSIVELSKLYPDKFEVINTTSLSKAEVGNMVCTKLMDRLVKVSEERMPTC